MTATQPRTVKFLDTPALAQLLDVSEDTVKRMRAKGTGPDYVKVNGFVRYPPWSVKAWSDAHTVKSAPRDAP